MDIPKISVIMACYKEPINWLAEAVDSILNQTMDDFEFIIVVDDPLNTELISVLQKYTLKDTRINVIVNTHNVGLAQSLNNGINASKSPIICRMDADDIADKERFKLQFEYLENNQHIDLVGSSIYKINENGNVIATKQYWNNMQLIQKIIPFCSVTCHPTWMFRKSLYEKINGYNDLFTAQDYDFLYRALDAKANIGNLEQPLLKYRVHQQSITGGFSLKRYKVRQYIHKMHADRAINGNYTFSKSELNRLVDGAESSNKVMSTLNTLRHKENINIINKAYYYMSLFIYSPDIRQRIFDHIRLKFILLTYRAFNK